MHIYIIITIIIIIKFKKTDNRKIEMSIQTTFSALTISIMVRFKFRSDALSNYYPLHELKSS